MPFFANCSIEKFVRSPLSVSILRTYYERLKETGFNGAQHIYTITIIGNGHRLCFCWLVMSRKTALSSLTAPSLVYAVFNVFIYLFTSDRAPRNSCDEDYVPTQTKFHGEIRDAFEKVKANSHKKYIYIYV